MEDNYNSDEFSEDIEENINNPLLIPFSQSGGYYMSKELCEELYNDSHAAISEYITLKARSIFIYVSKNTTLTISFTLDSIRVNMIENDITKHVMTHTGFKEEQFMDELIKILRLQMRTDISSFINLNYEPILTAIKSCTGNNEDI